METIEIIGFIIAVVPLLGGFYSYVHSENKKARERRAALLNEYREKIQMSPSIAGVMYYCETKSLNTDFYLKKVDVPEDSTKIEPSKKDDPQKDNPYKEMYINVVATLGFFDALCYTFITKNLGKDEFIYFWGEMKEIMNNPSICAYLLFLENRNFIAEEDKFATVDDLIDQIFPYCFLQVFSRVSLTEMKMITRSGIMRRYWATAREINKELKGKYQVHSASAEK
jgi:hypothetical protein